MYGLIFLEGYTHVGGTDLVYPKAIYVINTDEDNMLEDRGFVSFPELDYTKDMSEIRQDALDNWKKSFKQLDSILINSSKVVFAYNSHYEAFFHARKQSKGRLNMKECRILTLETKDNQYTNVGRSGAENVWSMYQNFKAAGGYYKMWTCSAARAQDRTKNHTLVLNKKKANYNNYSTGVINNQIKEIAERLGFEYTEQSGSVSILTVASEWKFNMFSRPLKVFRRNYLTYSNEEFTAEVEHIYSPLDAMIFIKEKEDREISNKLLSIEPLELEA